MAHFGISTDSLPMFLGNECVIAHLKTLRLQYRDIYFDVMYTVGRLHDSREERKRDFEQKGWIDIADKQIPLDHLFAFIGVQNPRLSLRLIKFRHKHGKTQARIAANGRHPWVVWSYSDSELDKHVEIFIYHKLNELTPNSGYGVHIYDANGNLKYKDGLNLLNRIRSIPINFRKVTQAPIGYISSEEPFAESDNPQLKNLGTDIAVLQTAHFIRTECRKTIGHHWDYTGEIYSSNLNEDGSIIIKRCDSFSIGDGKKHQYPSYAKGGLYLDDVVCTNHLLVIDKPS